MHTTLTKHAGQELDFGSDFTPQLAENDSLATLLAVNVMRGTGSRFDADGGRFAPSGSWVDVTSEFLLSNPAPAVASPLVTFRLKKRAAADEQAAGVYVVTCQCATANGETLFDWFELEVEDTGAV